MENDSTDQVEAETSFEIQLYIYDLSRGLAQSLLSQLLGKQIPGIWHTSIVAYGREYFFGGQGIESCNPGCTVLGEPQQIIQLGITEIPYSLFLEYIFSIASSSFCVGAYDLFHNNCNNFSNELANFLVGKGIPKEILDLPQEVLSTPLGATLGSFLSAFHIRPEGVGAQLSGPPQQSRSADRFRNQQAAQNNNLEMAEGGLGEAASTGEDIPIPSKRKAYKYSDPIICFKEIDGISAANKLLELATSNLSSEDIVFLREWVEFITNDNGGWSLGDEHLNILRQLLHNPDRKFDPKVTSLCLQTLQAAALKDEFVLLLHQDRKEHRLMSFLNTVEEQPILIQVEMCKLLLNLCSIPSSFDWLMYISDWFEENGAVSNNCRVTTKIAVNSLLNEKNNELRKLGLQMLFNISIREIFGDIATELSTALFQYLQDDKTSEEDVFLALTCLVRFMVINCSDIAQLATMLAPDFNKFKGKSERNDKIIQELQIKISGRSASG